MGCLDNKVPFNEMTIYHTSNATDFFGLYRYGYAPASTVGLFMISATATNSTWYENGVNNFVQASVPKNSFTGSSILLGYCKFADSGGKRECSFSSIGTGLSEKEAKTYYTIVANFHAYLKR